MSDTVTLCSTAYHAMAEIQTKPLPDHTHFAFEFTKVKEILELLTFLGKHVSTAVMTIHGNAIHIRYAEESGASVLYIRLTTNMIDRISCKKDSVSFAFSVKSWIHEIRNFKRDHIRLIRVYDAPHPLVPTQFHIKMEGANPALEVAESRPLLIDLPPAECEKSLSYNANEQREYPFVTEIKAKPFYNRFHGIREKNAWVRISVDWIQQMVVLEGLPEGVTVKFPCVIIPNPYSTNGFWHQWIERLKIIKECIGNSEAATSQIALMSDTTPPISNIFSTETIEKFAVGHRLNSCIRLFLDSNKELLIEFILNQSPSDPMESSSVEGWVGYRMEKRNDAVMQTTYHVECLPPPPLPSQATSPSGKRKTITNG